MMVKVSYSLQSGASSISLVFVFKNIVNVRLRHKRDNLLVVSYGKEKTNVSQIIEVELDYE